MTESKGKRKGWKIAAWAAAGVLVLGGGIGVVTAASWADFGAPAPTTETSSAVSEPVAKEITFGATPTDGAVEVNPITVPTLRITNGTLKSVQLAPTAGGDEVPGVLSEQDTVWTATGRLAFNTEYTFRYTVENSIGKDVQKTQTFHTVTAPFEADAAMYPNEGASVGTGQPIELNFSEPVVNKAAVEQAITVTSSAGQTGAWYWHSDTMARYRPEAFWTPNQTVTVDMKLFGVDFGNGMIGNFDKTVAFNIHNTRLAVVDNNTKTMNVYIDGQLTRTFPVTLGNEEWPSTIGYHVVMSQHESIPFRAESLGLKPGDPAYYEPFDASNASRLTSSGVFVHQALPSAQPLLGKVNVSHGCIGMSPEGAKYFMDTFDPGDVVQVLNTGYDYPWHWDGYGDWNIPWPEVAAPPAA